MCAATFPIERRTEMFRKLPTVLPIAILLGAVSAAPAPAQTHSHHVVQPHRQVPNYARAEGAYAFAPSATPSMATTSMATQSIMSCPTMEGYPDCHPDGRKPFTIYPAN
jgi:hypothetical protein